jgi:hypothetical protein
LSGNAMRDASEVRNGVTLSRAASAARSYGVVIVTPSESLSEMRPPCGMHAPIPNPFEFGPAANSVCALAAPLTFTVFPPASSDTPFALMNFGAFCCSTLRITCVPAGSETPLLPDTADTVVAVNLSPVLLSLLHTRDPDESSSVVPGPIVPVFDTGAAGGGGGAGAGAGVAAGVDAGAGAGAGVVDGAVVCAGCDAGWDAGARLGVRLSGARFSGARCEDPERCGAALVVAAAGGVVAGVSL